MQLSQFDKIWVYPNPHEPQARNSYLANLYHGQDPSKIHGLPKFTPAILWAPLSGTPALLHHHWFEFRSPLGLLRLIWRLMIMSLFKLLGGEVHWTLHNILPHNAPYPRLQRLLRHRLWKLADRVYVHHSSHIHLVQETLGWSHPQLSVCPHPDYNIEIEAQAPPEIKLPRGGFILIYGQVAPYKNTLKLAQALPDIPLIIAGVDKEPSPWTQELRELISDHPQHLWIERFITPQEEAWLHRNCAGVVFGFEEILYSGGVHLAHQYGCQLYLPQLESLAHVPGIRYTHIHDLQRLITLDTLS